MGLDPFVREQVDKMKAWVLPAASMQPRVSVTRWTSGVQLLSEDPFQARIVDGALELWDNSDATGSTGVPVYYDGGPLRIRFRFQVGRDPEWETAVRLGLQPVSLCMDPRREREPVGPVFELYYGGQGATTRPVRRLLWLGYDRASIQHKNVLADGDRVLDVGRDYGLEIEYVPGLDRVFIVLRDAGGRELYKPITWDIPFRLDRGLILVGGVRESLVTVGSPGNFASWRIQSLEVDASSSATRLALPEGGTPAELLLIANGELVAGRLREAERRYDEVIRRVGEERGSRILVRAHLYRSLLHLRAGRPGDAQADVKRALTLAPDEVLRRIRSASGALSPAERDALRTAAGM